VALVYSSGVVRYRGPREILRFRGVVRLRILVAALALLTALPAAARADSPTVVRGAVEGNINSVTSSYIAATVRRAEAAHAGLLVLVMNTPGGISSSMDEIVTSLLNSRVPVVAYVSPAGARSDSAGLFVAQAADLVAMAPGTNIGSAHPIDASGGNLTGDLGKKVLNDAVARVRNLATLHGRNADWCEKAVRESVNVNAEEAVGLHVADLVAKDLPALLAAVDGRVLARPHSGPVTLQTAGAAVEEASMPLPQQVLHALIDPNVAYLLFLVAIFGLIAEVTTPGAILPGTVGVISAVLALVAFASLPVNLAGLLLMLFAFALFVADIKAPTHGILTAGGLVSLLLGSIFLIDAGPVGLGISPWLIVGATAAVLLLFAFVVRKAISARARPAFAGSEALLGSIGEARERLEPAGTVFVAGALWRAVADGPAIAAGSTVRVVGRKGLELSVVGVRPETEGKR
jgi:membrane-bound serine protease (ClpP class)